MFYGLNSNSAQEGKEMECVHLWRQWNKEAGGRRVVGGGGVVGGGSRGEARGVSQRERERPGVSPLTAP